MIITLSRNTSTEQGTFGIMYCDFFSFYSLELPWRFNKQKLSCIPEGIYDIEYSMSEHPIGGRKDLYILLNVQDRAEIFIHAASFAGDIFLGWTSDLKGCISIGKEKGILKNSHGNPQNALLKSRSAIDEFIKIMSGRKAKLDIVNAFV